MVIGRYTAADTKKHNFLIQSANSCINVLQNSDKCSFTR